MARVSVSAVRFSSMLENRHMSAHQVAADIQVNADLLALVATDQILDFEDLNALAKRFKKPWSYLLLDEPEVYAKLGRDNRTFLNQQHPLSAEMLSEVDAAWRMLEAARDLFPDTMVSVPAAEVTVDTPIPEAANAVRAFLAVSFQAQLAARDEYATLRLWTQAVQARGVYVSQRRLRDDTVRAFSIASGEHAVIVVDTHDSALARVFSLIHEYVHIVLRSAGICDLDDHAEVERYCNAVAADALMPTSLLQSQLPTGHTFGQDLDIDENLVARLSGLVGVSQAAILIRLRDLKRLSQGDYDYLESRRTQRRSKQGKPGGDFYRTAINRVGKRFAWNVFSALDNRAIDRQDAGVLLEVGEHVVDRYRKELRRGDDGR